MRLRLPRVERVGVALELVLAAGAAGAGSASLATGSGVASTGVSTAASSATDASSFSFVSGRVVGRRSPAGTLPRPVRFSFDIRQDLLN